MPHRVDAARQGRAPIFLRLRRQAAVHLRAAALLLTACSASPPAAPDHGQAMPPYADAPADGLRHLAGDNAATARAFYGVPILQKSLYWDGNGDDDNYGLGFHLFRFVNDGLALGMGLNGAVWMEDAHDVYSGEWEALLRWYPGNRQFFWDVGGGYLHGIAPVPTGGTDWNFTFHFGPGVDIPVGRESSVLIGATYHHTSNALGRENERNPSQNDMRLWVAFAWNF
jgi:hypothetical protein